MIQIQLEEIVNALELVSDDGNSYLHKTTGGLYHFSTEELHFAKTGTGKDNGIPDWQLEHIRVAEEVIGTENYLQLPTKQHINEYGVMEQFCFSLQAETIGTELYNALKSGNGTQEQFRGIVLKHKLGAEWYKFKREAYYRMAIDWCRTHHLTYT